MRKVKRKETTHKEPMNSNKRIFLIAAIGVIAVVVTILMIIENQSGKIRVTNNTDLKLEDLKAYFVNAEGRMEEITYEYTNVEPGRKQSKGLNEINLLGREANLEIRFKFEGYEHKYVVDAGLFNDKFDGKINISFGKAEEGLISMKVKASNGFLSSRLITCDEEYKIDYQKGELIE